VAVGFAALLLDYLKEIAPVIFGLETHFCRSLHDQRVKTAILHSQLRQAMKTAVSLFILMALACFATLSAQQLEHVGFSAAASANNGFQAVVGAAFLANLNGAAGSLQIAGEYGNNTIEESALLALPYPAASALGVSVFPNPTREAFNITFEEAATTKLTARLFDLNGTLMDTQTFLNGFGTFGMQNFAGGAYVLELHDEKGQRTSLKVIKSQ
jgi:regulation of enolase protein 1 (concanavalin A-like superfamily)